MAVAARHGHARVSAAWGQSGQTLAQRLAAQLSIDGGPYLPVMLSIDGGPYQYVIVEDE